ncbi:CBS domain-containing protein [Marivivens donghaensis]|uniref:CBS domain-containing protein n=1 Tax=Marivivens donghaensis TaxID=1699413 RepID=A0ABX0VX92_9RHOB|nr:CBS domain-containing protein [Marivivens donghaensis]NIY72713.1 CBS domain-containing protein [Marivivens donghaensis]
MLVNSILNSKDKAGIIWLAADEVVSKAAELMSQNRIGTIIVSSNGETADGILSERDIVREIGKRGPSVLESPISEIMTANPITATGDKSADEVLQIMTDKRFRHMPVMADGKLVGLISIGDVVKARLAEIAMERDALEGMVMGH